MYAGHRDTIHQVILENVLGNGEVELCTGMTKIDGSIINKSDDGWFGLWGSAMPTPKSSTSETIGLGLVVPEKYFGGFTEDKLNHIVKLKLDNNNKAEFLITSAWAGEIDGPNSSMEFISNIKGLVNRTVSPIIVSTGYLNKR
jgi:hypothetical protein